MVSKLSSTVVATSPVLGSSTQWKHITATYVYDSNYGCYQYIYLGATEIASSREMAAGSQPFDPVNDIVRIGAPWGYLGEMKNLHIYSPGSVRVGGIFLFDLRLK